MKKRIIAITAILCIIAVIGFVLANNKKKIESNKTVVDRSQIPVAVSVYTVAEKPLESKFSLPAVLEAMREADVAVGIAGKITSLHIELGTRVAKGQVLGNIDSKQKELSLQATELSMQKLEKDYLRSKELLQGNAVTETSMLDAKYNYENTRLQAEQMKQQIADARILAPISGIVNSKKLEPGEFVNPGTVIATIVNTDQLKAIVYVNEKDIYQLKLGQAANISTDVFPDQLFKGSVTFISPKGDESHNYRVEVLVANNTTMQLKAGTYIQVTFDMNTRTNALQIPKTALAEGMKNPYVYVVNGNKAMSRKITTGRELGENIEVINGLQAGEQVINNGQINLVEGSLIEIIAKK